METSELLTIAISVLAVACGISLLWNIYSNTPAKRWERMVKQERKDRERMIKH